jgi:acylphosphatase
MQKARVHLIIHGYVQGIFYRASTRETALRLGLNGWVRNMADGNVEALFEGSVENLQNAIEWCRQGPPGAKVTRIDEKWSDSKTEFDSFEIRHGF